MRLTKASDYAIVSLAYLATQPAGNAVSVRMLSEALGIPKDFLSRIFHGLPMVKAVHGNRGGYVLARPASQITMREILENVEGSVNLNLCSTQPSACDKTPNCTLAPRWMEIQTAINHLLDDTTLAELAGLNTARPVTAAPTATTTHGGFA